MVNFLRQKPAHNKNHCDQAFSELADEYYGNKSKGDARIDVLDYEQMEAACNRVFGSRLKVFEEIKGNSCPSPKPYPTTLP